MNIKKFILGISAAVVFTSCSKDSAEDPTPNPPTPGGTVTAENVTYKNFGATFFASKCNACHAAGGAGSSQFVFSGYNSVKDNADRIRNAVLVARVMPQGGSLTETERTLLDAWFKRNLPEE
jgi:uncharacterized membrane protein